MTGKLLRIMQRIDFWRCPYIPSERVLGEGGYEGTESMPEYGYPSSFTPGLEEQILGAAREALPKNGRA